jgi:thioredoxin 2
MDTNILADHVHVVCPHCDKVNRVATDRSKQAVCGSCGEPLFTGHPLVLRGASLEKHIARSDLPVLVDFWAPWCGPCHTMAPAFEQAARELEPGYRLVKLNTDEEPEVAQRHGIRGIPTFALFRHGAEVARIAGAMDPARFMAWVRAHS